MSNSKIQGLKLNSSDHTVSQEIDFDELVDVDLSDEDTLKREISQAIIDKVVDRTESGRDSSGASMGKYSESYKNSLDFKAFGKSDPVDLKLTSDMLTSVDIVKESGNKVTLGLIGELQNAKAYGHQTGMKGHPFLEGKVKPREWFGMSYEDIKKDILSNFRGELHAVQKRTVMRERDDTLKAAQDFLRQALEEDEDDGT